MSKLSKALAAQKPWAHLRMSRKKYESLRLWKDTGLSREQFEALVLTLPQDFVEKIYEEARADMLVEAIFNLKENK